MAWVADLTSRPPAISRGRLVGATLAIFLVTLGVYWASAVVLDRTHTPDMAYFDQLADAFLQGRLYLLAPQSTHDLTRFAGRWYVPFPPMPALLLMPWVAVAGVGGVNTVLFSAVIGALNSSLAFWLLRELAERRWISLGGGDLFWLTALWAFGSVHWYMSTLGTVWFVSQLVTATFMLLAAVLALRTRQPFWSGLALVGVLWSRPLGVLVLPFVAVMGTLETDGRLDLRRPFSWAATAALPIVLGALALLAYNQVRFADPLDFGYLTQNVSREVLGDLRRYGQFNLHYLPRNLWAMLLALPVVDEQGRWVPIIEGMSLLVTTPAILLAHRAHGPRWLIVSAVLAIVLLWIPLGTYYNTGWWQFGYRFSLDFMVPLWVLIALGARRRAGWLSRALILIGVVVNAWGTWWFLNPLFFD